MPDWVETACAEYIKRMPRELETKITEIKPEKRAAGNSTENVQLAEAKRLLDAVGRDYLVACDEHGVEMTTLTLAEKLKDWKSLGRDVSLVIGGPDGLHQSIKQKADLMWGLSKLTLPHAFVRVLLCEQLYRAHTVIIQHPYHRE